MKITAEALRTEKANLEQQRDQALAVYQQSLGALQLIEAMLQQLESEQPESMTIDQFAERVAGNGATAVIEKVPE